MAIYEDCNSFNEVDCVADDCGNENDKVLDINNLVIGEIYHFMIDGCWGSACDVEISVVGNCTEEIEDFTNPIEGEVSVCIGDTEDYEVDELTGATSYHWFIDGNEVSVTDDNEESITWNTEGSFLLCVDASNECIPVSDDPMPICTTVVVAAPDAGTLTATPDNLCPDGISSITLVNYNDGNLYENHIIITDPTGVVLEIFTVPPTTFDVTYDECGQVKVYSLNFASSENVPLPSINDDYSGSDCVDFCCNETCETIDFEDKTDPDFPSAPADETIECFGVLPAMVDQLATDNCQADEMITGVETGSADLCNGGTIIREWTQTDACNNSYTHTQTITVDPFTPPMYNSMPGDVTLDCDELLPSADDLMYSNGGTGVCLEEGLVTPVVAGTHDICGTMITYTWDYTDSCNNDLNYVQTITILPAPEADYISAPGDVTLECSDPIPPPIDLMYTNSSSGVCLLEGTISPTVDGVFDPCGSTVTYTWEYTDPCGNDLIHTQTIEVDPADPPVFINPPQDLTLDCSGTVPPAVDLDYSNSESGVCLVEGLVTPTVNGVYDPCGSTIEYTWEFTDPCGNDLMHTQTITVEPAMESSFINPPPDETFSCATYEGYSFIDLMYTNSDVGACLIEGTVSPTITDNRDECDGQVLAEYEFTDDCDRTISHTQTITIEPPLEASFLNTPPDFTIDCNNIPPDADPLDYTNNELGSCLIEGNEDPVITEDYNACGGSITNLWEHIDDCDRKIEYTQTITIDPAIEAAFTSMPVDLTMSCEAFNDFVPETLDYTNGETSVCLIEGSEDATTNDEVDYCGGVVVYIWEFTDDCDRTITEDQEITVEPAPEAMFINVPADMTLDCSEADNSVPSLDYANEAAGVCEIEGEVDAIVTGFVDECGGVKTFDWTFTDDCGRTITATQEITYLPAPDPEFIDPPDDLTIDCDEEVPDPIELEYDNDLGDPCEIRGEEQATVVITDNIYEYTWEYTNQCTGNTITHTQVLTKLIPVELDIDEFEFTTCLMDEFDLSTISLEDLNGTNIEQTYHDDDPTSSSNEIDPEVIIDEEEKTFFIRATNEFGCYAEAEVNISANILVSAGEDVEEGFCKDAGLMDLYSFLHWTADTYGEFTQLDGPDDLDIVDAYEVNVADAEPGIYLFEYSIDGDGSCPGDVSEIEIELYPFVLIELISIECNADGLTYKIEITNDDYDVDIDVGDITLKTTTMIIVDNIPLSVDFEIEAQHRDNKCENNFSFKAPDCSCPPVDKPLSLGNQKICEGEAIPDLAVMVGNDETANWYDAMQGGNLLLAANTNYTPTVSTPGLYNYYVEAESLAQAGCVSSSRTSISLEIISNPKVVDTTLIVCDINANGVVSVEQTQLDAVAFNGFQNLTASYYPTIDDRTNGTNQVFFPKTVMKNGSNIFYTRIMNSAGCETDISVSVSISDLPEIIPTVVDERCSGDENGSISLVARSTALPVGVYYRNDSLTNLTLSDLRPGNFSFVAVDNLGCRDTIETTVNPGLELILSSIDYNCNDNGTNTDPSDDFYTLELLVTNNGAVSAPEYELLILPFNVIGNFAYDELVTIELPADGLAKDVQISDLINGCNIAVQLDELLACSSDCTAAIDLLEYNCNNNGTGLDPSDDFYEVTLTASAMNGSNANTYNVLLDGIVSYSFSYGSSSTFEIPSNGNSVEITVSDSQFGNCTAAESTTMLEPCSDDCLIEATVVSKICNNAGTPALEEDDYFTLEVAVTGVNVGTTYTVEGSVNMLPYSENLIMDNLLITDGVISLSLNDTADNSCATELMIEPPLACSEPCETVINALSVSDCDNNGTLDDASDDFYNVIVNVGLQDGVASGVMIADNLGNSYGPFNYDSDINLGPFVADGTEVILTITDLTNGSCLLQETVSQNSCSDDCIIDAQLVAVVCNDNGTTDDNDDDFFTATILVEGINVSTNGFIANGGTLGVYGQELIFNDNLILDGDLDIEIMDADDATCRTSLQIPASAACSSPCTIEWMNLEAEICEDNGTGTDPSDDFYAISFIVTTTNGVTSTYLVTDNFGNNYGPFDYGTPVEIGPFDADGAEVTLSVTDETNVSCNLSGIVSQLSCSDLCLITAAIVDVNCNNNGTAGIDTDDIYGVELTVVGINTASSYLVNPLGLDYDFGQNLILGNLVIADGPFTLTLVDGDRTDCLVDVDITPPGPCSMPCTVNLENFTILDCNDNMTGSLFDDDTFEVLLSTTSDVGAGNEFSLRDDEGNLFGPYPYDQEVTIGPLPANGSSILLTLEDESNGSCELSFTVMSDPCSACMQTITLEADNPTINCDNGVATITATLSEVASTISWTGPDGFTGTMEIVQVSLPGEYEVVASFADGCTVEARIFINSEDETPISVLGPDFVLDCDNTSLVLDLSLSTLTQNTLVEWLDENDQVISNADEIEITAVGTYKLLLTDTLTKCVSMIEEVEVTVNDKQPLAVIYADPDSILNCFIETINLTSEVEQNTVYNWTFNGLAVDESPIIVAEEGIITLVAIDTISHCDNMSTLRIEDLTQYPIIELSPIEDLDCIGTEVCVTASSPTTNPLSYTWYDENDLLVQTGNPTLCITQAGTYRVELADLNNDCKNSESFTIDQPLMPTSSLPELITLEIGETYTLEATISIPIAEISSILWETEAELSCYDCLNPMILSAETGQIISLLVTTEEACETRAQTVIIIDDFNPPKVYIPNVFDPELDGFTLYANEEIELIREMYVYDRWGNLVFENQNFEPNNPSLGWDGRFGNGKAEQGVYVYLFVYDINERTEYDAGDVTLLR